MLNAIQKSALIRCLEVEYNHSAAIEKAFNVTSEVAEELIDVFTFMKNLADEAKYEEGYKKGYYEGYRLANLEG